MKNLIPYKYPEIHIRESHDVRLSHAISSEITANTKVVLIGFPFDEGVRINGGFPGAKKAPSAIRAQLAKMIAFKKALHGAIVDLGDVDVEGKSVEQAQELLGEIVSEILTLNLIPIILGGGHETAYGHLLGYFKSEKSVEVINLDAHTDVRELVDGKAHSGSPFRQGLEHESGLMKAYHVLGAKRNRVAEDHTAYVKKHGSIQFYGEEINIPIVQKNVLLTIDCDVFDVSVMPGVSARNGNGMSKKEGLSLIQNVLKTEQITSIDIVECNPDRDQNEQSVLFVAEMLYEILRELIT